MAALACGAAVSRPDVRHGYCWGLQPGRGLTPPAARWEEGGHRRCCVLPGCLAPPQCLRRRRRAAAPAAAARRNHGHGNGSATEPSSPPGLHLSPVPDGQAAGAMPEGDQVAMYDTTCRDGAQMVGISLTVADKLKIAAVLSGLGVSYLEGGWPGSNPKDAEFFSRFPAAAHPRMRIAAFGATRRAGESAASDAQVTALLDCNAPVVCIVAKASLEQVTRVLRVDGAENVAMIRETVARLVAAGREVMLDAEHFFDGYKADAEYALACLAAAAEAGAGTLVLCDTNGGTLPWEVEAATRAVAARLPAVRLGGHFHNDCGLAVANSLAAVRGGARLIQGCVNGYGERTGNADLLCVMAALQLKMGHRVCTPEQLGGITAAAKRVAEIAHQPEPRCLPFVGASSFAHKGGLHVAAIRRWEHAYNHIPPGIVGNAATAVVSELSGRSNLLERSERTGLKLSSGAAGAVLAAIKEKERLGFAYEAAGASVDMVMVRHAPSYAPPFRVLEYSVLTVNRGGDAPESVSSHQAVVKLTLAGAGGTDRPVLMAGEGVGPVDALAGALRAALTPEFPQLASVGLADYAVRLLDLHGESSTTRVTITFRDGLSGTAWATVGADASILQASVRALVDGLEYAILRCGAGGCLPEWGGGEVGGGATARMEGEPTTRA